MQMMEQARDTVSGFLNSRDRSAGHVATGLLICAGVVAVTAIIAVKRAPTSANPELERQYDRLDKPDLAPPKDAYAVSWSPLLSMALSGIRIWNAPRGRERDLALGLWAVIQVLHAAWTAWSPKQRLQQFVTSAATLAATALYTHQASKVDRKAATMVAPYAGWVGFANLVSEELWRKNRDKPSEGMTLH